MTTNPTPIPQTLTVPDGDGGTVEVTLPPTDPRDPNCPLFPAFDLVCIREANRRAGQHWFDPGAVRFFNSRISPRVYAGAIFVSSEKGPSGVRLYSVHYCARTGRVEEVSEFQAFASSRAAHVAAERVSKAWQAADAERRETERDAELDRLALLRRP